jgi:transcriptional regulator with XRE-family HTH domain
MEFKEKLQELRKKRGITQEKLARDIYVSRAAISKWESGRGYPNIDSLKALAGYFKVSVDELLSGDELIVLAEEETKKSRRGFIDLIYGLIDIAMAMLLFLPFFASRQNGAVNATTLLSLTDVQPYLKVIFLITVSIIITIGILELALQGTELAFWNRSKAIISLSVGALATLLFIISAQPYAAAFAFVLLLIKGSLIIKHY